MDPFDRIIEGLILIGVWVGVWIEWQSLQQRRRQHIKSSVTRLLRRLGVKHA